jgi:hypothetical protein
MVSILNEKIGWIDRSPGPIDLLQKLVIISGFSSFCNGFLTLDPLFIRLLSLIFQATRHLLSGACNSALFTPDLPASAPN